jgi:arylmalonate decarboxylase
MASAIEGAAMTFSRREFLQAGIAIGVGAGVGSAETRPLLGLIAPPADFPIPPEGVALYDSTIRFSVVGLGLKTMTPAGYDSVIDKIVPAAVELKKRGATAIDLLGTSLTFYRGAAFNAKLLGDIRKATGLKTTSMSTAIIDGLRAVGAKRIAAATAYNEEVNRRLNTFLNESGFEVLTMRGLGLEAIGDPGKVTQAELQKFSADVFKQAPKADALLVSCGGLRTLEILAPLEEETRVPVVSSLPHALWAGMRLLGLRVKANGYGRLLANG